MSFTITRRGVVQLGAAMAASPAVLAAAKLRGSSGPEAAPIAALIVDSRSTEGHAFADTAAARGMLVHRFRGDLADVYYGRFSPHWRQQGSAALGGLTRVESLFYLERMAWDSRMRLVFLGRHTSGHDVPALHNVRGPQATVDFFHDLVRVVDWPVALVHTLIQVPFAVAALRPLNAVRDAVISGDQALFSWVLAPISRSARPAAHEISV